MPEDIRISKERDKRTGDPVFVVLCDLPWNRLESRSSHQATAVLALWETLRHDCNERGIDLIWRAVKSRTLVLRAELLQVLRNERNEPVMADLVILEKLRPGKISVEQLSAPRIQITGKAGDPYKASSFAVHLPYNEVPQPKGRSYHKEKPQVGDRYTVEFKVEFDTCSACGSMQVMGQPILYVDKQEVRSIWLMHYYVASYEGRAINQNEIMESLERLDLGRTAVVTRKELPQVIPVDVRYLSNGADTLFLPPEEEDS